ncbi:YeaC family protein [Porticoccus sp.]|uniref:YeaC family protein n=1 Tax=Porticoccus sp. TaxID=2024853 RepID=UPI003F699D08
MDFQQLIDSITPDIYESLKQSVERGKWPDGRKLTPAQREHSMQAIIAYDLRHKPEDQRVGYVPPKQKIAGPCDTSHPDQSDDQQPLKWLP